MTKGLNLLKKSALLLVFTFLIVLSAYSAVGDTTKVRVHDKVDMTWYGNYDVWGAFPDGSATYGKVEMHYTMGCASTGCSPWDYTTQIFLLHNTGEIDSVSNDNRKMVADNCNNPDHYGYMKIGCHYGIIMFCLIML